MIKARTFAVAALVAAAPLAMSATQAFAATSHVAGTGAGALQDSTLTLAGQQAVFNQGGDELGHGAAMLISSAYIGGPQGILDIPAHVLGMPKALTYLP